MRFLRAALFLLLPAVYPVSAQSEAPDDTLEFLAEEARVVSASAREQPLRRAPATTYVITGDELRSSGAVTLWDALRRVPGLDVVTGRSMNGTVGARGLIQGAASRMLVLLDGRTLLSGFLQTVNWEEIPVTLGEIDRIEIVEGPVSALYGANGLSGAINIITKTPEQAKGSRAAFSYGERGTVITSLLHGESTARRGTRFMAGYRTSNSYEDKNVTAAETGRMSLLERWTLDEDTELALSGGITRSDIQTGGPPSLTRQEGITGFGRADARWRKTSARFFWNAGRTSLQNFPVLGNPVLDYDTYDLTLEQGWAPADNDDVTFGAGYRRNVGRSPIFDHDVHQDLPSLYFENEWRALEQVSFIAGARLDHHPLAGWFLSPRGSLLYFASPRHTLRFTAGLAFRNPTLLEDYVNATIPVNGLDFVLLGNEHVRPERMQSFELSHRGDYGRVRTTLTGFQYALRDVVAGEQSSDPAVPTRVLVSVANHGATRALGYQAEVEATLERRLTGFANYTYQYLRDEDNGAQTTADSAPKHKANGGLRLRDGGLTASLWETWVDHTLWPSGAELVRVPAYGMLNVYAGYRFSSGRLKNVELGASGFNVLNERHTEQAPFVNSANPGQGAERLGSRWVGTVAYSF